MHAAAIGVISLRRAARIYYKCNDGTASQTGVATKDPPLLSHLAAAKYSFLDFLVVVNLNIYVYSANDKYAMRLMEALCVE